MSEQNKAIVRRIYDEVINKGNLALFDQLVAPDVIEHEALPGFASDREGVKQFFTMFRAAFPDLHFTAEDMIAEGDKVATRITVNGTHKGEFMGIAPTGKQITMTGIDILRFADGKVVEHWGNTDDLGMMQQLGVVPAMG
jgi:steroid delta-isomerase-like uncharacterized protein